MKLVKKHLAGLVASRGLRGGDALNPVTVEALKSIQNAETEVIARAGLFPQDWQAKLANNEVQIKTKSIYSVKELEAGTKMLDMFREDDNKSIGRCSITGAKIDSNSLFVNNAIRFSYALVGTGKDYTTANFQALPVEIINGEMKLVLGEHTHLQNTPMSKCTQDVSEGFKIGTYNLDAPVILDEDTVVQVVLELTAGISYATGARGYVKVELEGIEIR